MAAVSRGVWCSALGRGHSAFDRNEAIRAHRYGINAALDKEGGKLGVVTGCLATQTDVGASLMGLGDDALNHPLDRIVLFIEKLREICRVAVNAQRQLRQIVAAN